MSDISEKLNTAWKEASYEDSFTQLDINHPLVWAVGLVGKNEGIVVEIPEKNVTCLSSKTINVSCNKRFNGTWALTFELLDTTETAVFLSMCCDLIEISSYEHDKKNAYMKLIVRYNQWYRLLEKKNKEGLSEERRKGLIGEILFINHLIAKGMDKNLALRGWVGPEGNDQDFVFSETWYEIKSTGKASDRISISSLEQLSNDQPGNLVIQRLDKCSKEKKNGFSLNDIVKRTRKLLNDTPMALNEFNFKLLEAGYEGSVEYDEPKFEFSSGLIFRVDKKFPRILRKNVPAEIPSATYYINISAIQAWKDNEYVDC